MPFNPNAVMAVPAPAATHPHRSRMRTRRPAAPDPDPLTVPCPLPRNPEPNRHWAGRDGYDFGLRRRWRSYHGRRLLINHTTGQQWEAGGNQQ